MNRDPETGIRLLDGHLSYRDGSEDRVLEILRRASDRSSDSDELAAAVTDWPSRYHLSRQRANLLRPLRLGPGMRVLEVGAGTGAISRYLGETGAEVVALEGNLERARAAAVRCSDLANVEVVCGPLASFEDPDGFDLVCVVGVLEYAASGAGGSSDHQAFLNRAAWLIRSGGGLLLAIENQIGVKYLLGYHEDHLGLPWVGIDGYRGDHGIRTFTRTALRAMLAAAGLSNQTWFFPFPRLQDADRRAGRGAVPARREPGPGRSADPSPRGRHRRARACWWTTAAPTAFWWRPASVPRWRTPSSWCAAPGAPSLLPARFRSPRVAPR